MTVRVATKIQKTYISLQNSKRYKKHQEKSPLGRESKWRKQLIYTLEVKNSAKTQKDDEELFLSTTSDEEEELHTDLLAICDHVSTRVTQSQLPGLASTSSAVLESVGSKLAPIPILLNITALGLTTLTKVNPGPEDLTTPLAVIPLPADIWTPTELATSPQLR
ncbi:hypothetical protein K439DRAFT_1658750 [Ramaria rubella]|nr:hypothetical protein K439DRAFT_1658750 [Ramaria rubella]